MKFKVLISAILFFSVSSLFAGDQLFKGADDKTMYVYPSIPIIEGADLQEFHEAYSKSRFEQVGELVNSAKGLLGAGASGAEALEMILAFDNLVTHRRAYSKKRMGVSLEGYFNGRLSELYRTYEPPVRKLDFKHVDLPTNILRHANQERRPGYLTDADMVNLDFVIYGSYTVAFGGNIDMSLYVLNVNSGVTRIFNGRGNPKQAAYYIADQLFHEFQKTRFPSVLKLGSGKSITLLGADRIKVSGYAQMKNIYEDARYSCEDLGGRLVNKRELSSIGAAGTYRGGVTVSNSGRENYYWALDRDDIYVSYENRVTKKWSLNSTQYLNYICVSKY